MIYERLTKYIWRKCNHAHHWSEEQEEREREKSVCQCIDWIKKYLQDKEISVQITIPVSGFRVSGQHYLRSWLLCCLRRHTGLPHKWLIHLTAVTYQNPRHRLFRHLAAPSRQPSREELKLRHAMKSLLQGWKHRTQGKSCGVFDY